jgi:hypothetical protein
MGQSAAAKLVYGVDFGDEECESLPDWVASRYDTECGEYGVLNSRAERALERHGLTHEKYGWEFNSNAIGVRLLWAIDYGSEQIDTADLLAKIEEARPRIEAALREMGAPDDVRPGLFILAAYN